jgi:hypothetical protein
MSIKILKDAVAPAGARPARQLLLTLGTAAETREDRRRSAFALVVSRLVSRQMTPVTVGECRPAN